MVGQERGELGPAMTDTEIEQRKRRFKDAFERLSAERGVDRDPLMQQWYAGTLPIAVMRGFVMEYDHWEYPRGFAATFTTQRRERVTGAVSLWRSVC